MPVDLTQCMFVIKITNNQTFVANIYAEVRIYIPVYQGRPSKA
jgi:hypothetical protein